MNSDISQSILIIDDDVTFCEVLARALDNRGYQTDTAHDREQTTRILEERTFDKIILDLNIGNDSGLSLLPDIINKQEKAGVVILTGYSSIATAVQAIKLGAINYLCKPADADEILAAFENRSGNPEIAPPEQPPSIERIQWEHIQKVLNENNGNISETARKLGMHRRTLQRKLRKKPAQR